MTATTVRVPSAALAADRVATYAAAAEVLAPWLYPQGLRVSPLGAEYSTDVDAHVVGRPDDAVLRAADWVCLDPLLERLGSHGEGRWAVLAHGRVVGKVDLRAGPPPDPLAHVLARCRRRGAGERELAELAELRSKGRRVPTRPPRRSPRSRVSAMAHRLATPWAPRLVVGLSGVDGSGKSTVARELLASLQRAGVPAARISVRPGVLAPWLTGTVRCLKRAARVDPAPGLQVAAERSTPVGRLRSRRGLVGRLWLSALAVEFASELWRAHLTSRGVVLFDRHRLDARVTVAVFYDVPVTGRVARLFATLVPRAAVQVYLELPAEVAVRRKPDVFVGPQAVLSQVEVYRALLRHGDDGSVVLDATAPVDELTLQVFELVVDPARWRR